MRSPEFHDSPKGILKETWNSANTGAFGADSLKVNFKGTPEFHDSLKGILKGNRDLAHGIPQG